MNTTGEKLKVSIFGQSHSPYIGCIIDGLPAGLKIDTGRIKKLLLRRLLSGDVSSTSRKESDEFEIVSGLYEGRTCGAPLTVLIKNGDVKKADYEKIKNILRPSHSDYTAWAKFAGFNDRSGGGQFSGRLTAPLCAAGAVCMQYLESKDVNIRARALSIGNIRDRSPFDKPVAEKKLPVSDDGIAAEMIEYLRKVKEKQDSAGGVIECVIDGVKAGLGEPMFGGIENVIAKNVFAIPAVKGIEFGAGFAITEKTGSEANDAFEIRNKKIITSTNNSGGIQGGISNGMSIVFRVAVKPVPSIGIEQQTVDIKEMKPVKVKLEGRFDTCAVFRAVPAVEAVAAISILDLFY